MCHKPPCPCVAQPPIPLCNKKGNKKKNLWEPPNRAKKVVFSFFPLVLGGKSLGNLKTINWHKGSTCTFMWPTVKAHVFFVKKPEFTLTAMLSPNNIACYFFIFKIFLWWVLQYLILSCTLLSMANKFMKIDNFLQKLWELTTLRYENRQLQKKIMRNDFMKKDNLGIMNIDRIPLAQELLADWVGRLPPPVPVPIDAVSLLPLFNQMLACSSTKAFKFRGKT